MPSNYSGYFAARYGVQHLPLLRVRLPEAGWKGCDCLIVAIVVVLPLSSSSGSGPPRFIDDSLASLVDEEETLRSEKCGLVRLKLFTRTLVRHLHHL